MPVPKGYTVDPKIPHGYKLDTAPAQQPHESPNAIIPPELERIKHAIGVNYAQGKPFSGYGGKDVIASVANHEPHTIEINNKARWNQAPLQEMGHEIVHLWRSNLPGPIQKSALPVDPRKPYDLSNIDSLRSQGHTLATIPEEQAARIMQTWVADPSQRQKLQPWVNDLKTVPLSTMDATAPGDKTINRHPRAPIPPPEEYGNLGALLHEARTKKP